MGEGYETLTDRVDERLAGILANLDRLLGKTTGEGLAQCLRWIGLTKQEAQTWLESAQDFSRDIIQGTRNKVNRNSSRSRCRGLLFE